jgi:hypothetical protein
MSDTTDNETSLLGDEGGPYVGHTALDDTEDDWMTQEQVARHLGVTAIRVREWIESGMLTPQVFGSIEKVRRSEVDTLGNPDDSAAEEFEKDHSAQ